MQNNLVIMLKTLQTQLLSEKMIMIFSKIILMLCILFSSAYADSINWIKLAVDDLQAVHNQLLSNAPQPLDPNAKIFHAWIDRGLVLSLQRTSQVNDSLSYSYLLRYYTAGFKDGLSIQLQLGDAET